MTWQLVAWVPGAVLLWIGAIALLWFHGKGGEMSPEPGRSLQLFEIAERVTAAGAVLAIVGAAIAAAYYLHTGH